MLYHLIIYTDSGMQVEVDFNDLDCYCLGSLIYNNVYFIICVWYVHLEYQIHKVKGAIFTFNSTFY